MRMSGLLDKREVNHGGCQYLLNDNLIDIWLLVDTLRVTAWSANLTRVCKDGVCKGVFKVRGNVGSTVVRSSCHNLLTFLAFILSTISYSDFNHEP